MFKKKNILIIHGYSGYPLRSTVRDILFCYERYLPDARCFYLNLHSDLSIPGYILRTKWDLIIFHTLFLSGRWLGKEFSKKEIIDKVLLFSKIDAVRIMLPQDEWIHTTVLKEFIEKIGIHHVFSVTPEPEWPIVYKGIDFNKVYFHEVLTGYIDEKVVKKIKKIKKNKNFIKDIDIGYRAFKSPPWLGKHGFLKTKIADVFNEAVSASKYKTDISTKQEDTILGDKWYEFMLRCRYFIGVEGGSTVLDPEGDIWKKGIEFTRKNPHASYDEIEQAVFPGLEGSVNFVMLSPRHLEATFTETAQVLIEGRYNNILKPGIHYIELKKDFSNLDSVLEMLENEELRKVLVENSYRDIVASGNYTYSKFVRDVLQTSLKGVSIKNKSLFNYITYLRNWIREKNNWRYLRILHDENLYMLSEKSYLVMQFLLAKRYLKFTFFPKVIGKAKKIIKT